MSNKLITLLAVLTFLLCRLLERSTWWWFIPIYLAYFIAWNGFYILIYERFINPLSRIPGPKVQTYPKEEFNGKGHWFWGEFPAIRAEEPGQAHLRWSREFRNPTGLVSYPGLFYRLRVMPTSTSAIQHVLTNTHIYVKPEQARRSLRNILGQGLLNAEGEMHRRQRKVLNPAFATGYIRDIVPIFVDKGNDLVDTLLEEVKSQPAEGIELSRFLSRSTLDIIGSAGFGYEFNSLHNPDDPFATAYAKIFHQTPSTRMFNLAAQYIPLLRNLPFPRVLQLARARRSVVKHATRLVQDRESQPVTGKDLLSLMIAENLKAEGKLAEMELVDQVMTFLFAGHETTATALVWTLWVLAQHQDIQDRLRAEVQHLQNPTFEEIESCRYLNNVCREMLRYIPPVSVTIRKANSTDRINGVTIPKGAIIFLVIPVANFDETVWGEDIDKFNPDRWDKLPEKVSNYNYLTFLQGPRSCIGRRFAEVEMKALLIALVQRLKFDEVVKGRHVEKQAIITTRPKGGMWLKLSPAS